MMEEFSITAYASQCVEHRVFVRGRACERHDRPTGKVYFILQDGGGWKMRVVSERYAKLRSEIDAAIDGAAS